jgi:hypothetical protein
MGTNSGRQRIHLFDGIELDGMTRPIDDTDVDSESMSIPPSGSLRTQMCEFVADNGADIDLKTARQVDAEGNNLFAVVIEDRGERVG